MKVTSGSATDPGKRYSHNEDSHYRSDQHMVYAVADGIGGSSRGEVASRLFVEILGSKTPDLRDTNAETWLRKVIGLANREIGEIAPGGGGSGSTCTILHLAPGRFHVANVGDSRTYLFRENTLRQLTVDHSLENELSHEESKRYHIRGSLDNVITRSLGAEEEVEADVFRGVVLPGDLFLLCSDGLYKEVPEPDIEKLLEENHDPESGAAVLVRRAVEKGGRDNITVVLARVDEQEDLPEVTWFKRRLKAKQTARKMLPALLVLAALAVFFLGLRLYHDYIPPALPVIHTFPEQSRDTTVRLGGVGKAGAMVLVTVNGKQRVTTIVNDDGSWAADVGGLQEGNNKLNVGIASRKGIKNSRRHERVVFVDTVPLKHITIHYPEDGSSTSESIFIITLTTDPRADTIIFIDDTRMPGRASVDKSGAGSYHLPEPLTKGFHELLAVARYLGAEKKSGYVVFQVKNTSSE